MDWRGIQSIRIAISIYVFSKVWSSQGNGKVTCRNQRKQEIANLEEICAVQVCLWGRNWTWFSGLTSVNNLRGSMLQFQVIEKRKCEGFDNIFYLRLYWERSSFFAGQHIPLGVEEMEIIWYSSLLLNLITFFHFILWSIFLVLEGSWQIYWRNWFKKKKERNYWGIIQRTMSPMNSQLFVLKYLTIRYIFYSRYTSKLENRHPYLLMRNMI